MSNLRDTIINNIITEKLTSWDSNVVPSILSVKSSAVTSLDDMFDPANIASVQYQSNTSASSYNAMIRKALLLLSSSSSTLVDLVSEQEQVSSRYRLISTKIYNQLSMFRNTLNQILNCSCKNVSMQDADQTAKSDVIRIGRYIILPFDIADVQAYTGNISISLASSGSTLFSNLEALTALPLVDPASLKIVSDSRNINVSINVSLEPTTVNLIYIRFLNEISGGTATAYYLGEQIYTAKITDPEILLNFDSNKIDTISLNLNLINSNTSKPISVQFDKMLVLGNIQFSSQGILETKSTEITKANAITSLKLAMSSVSDNSTLNIDTYLSIGAQPELISYNRTDPETSIDLTAFKYKHVASYELASTSLETFSIGNKNFYKIPLETSTLSSMDYKSTLIFYGVNRDYASMSIRDTSNAFENWTKVGNSYKTTLINNEEGIWLNVGSKTCSINGKTYTGKFLVPVGISVIEINAKDYDPMFGQEEMPPLTGGMVSNTIVKSDPLYPLNFAYVLAGLPDYNGDDTLSSKLDQEVFYLDALSDLYLGSPVLANTVEVIDSKGRAYTQQIAKIPSSPGTFVVQPNAGKVMVNPISGDTITIKFRRADHSIKPCGILCNRLLTFIPLKALQSLSSLENSTFFSIDMVDSKRFLVVPQVIDPVLTHASISYSTQADSVYAAVYCKLQTTNQNLTPIIKNISIQGR